MPTFVPKCVLYFLAMSHGMQDFGSLLLLFSHSIMSYSLQPHGLHDLPDSSAWDSPGKNTALGCHFLLQGIFLSQRSNSCLLQVSCIAGRFFTTEPPGKPFKLMPLCSGSTESEVLDCQGSPCLHFRYHFCLLAKEVIKMIIFFFFFFALASEQVLM